MSDPLSPLTRAERPRAGRPHRGPRASPNPPGRAPYVPTDEHRRLVTMLRGAGVDLDTIARLLKCAPSTVEKHFKTEMQHGKDEVRARVSAKLVSKALSGDNSSMQFYLRCHGGDDWKEKRQLEHSGLDGAPLVPPNLVMGFLQPLQPATDDEQPAH